MPSYWRVNPQKEQPKNYTRVSETPADRTALEDGFFGTGLWSVVMSRGRSQRSTDNINTRIIHLDCDLSRFSN